MADKCKVTDKGIALCETLAKCREYGNPKPRSKGVFIPFRVNFGTGEPVLPVAQIHSGSFVGGGAAMYFCPFCGESLKTWSDE